jgi:prevent-host-death family protein
MTLEFTIAEAKNRLSEIVHQAETGKRISLTRRGKPVAVLVSEREYARLTGKSASFWAALAEFRARTPVDQLGISKRDLNALRAAEPGRKVAF